MVNGLPDLMRKDPSRFDLRSSSNCWACFRDGRGGMIASAVCVTPVCWLMMVDHHLQFSGRISDNLAMPGNLSAASPNDLQGKSGCNLDQLQRDAYFIHVTEEIAR